ncbi:unnamed protein product [Polarella glacialis]|uniref:Uncharacterized protein n=1 Tax=Polarella glacialis TaxID=89957 RepID=A0A813FNA2_POLGL|nr:unnamed protein product [Polarella glacialis]
MQYFSGEKPEFSINRVDGQWQGSVALRFRGGLARSAGEARGQAAAAALEAVQLWSSHQHVHHAGGAALERDASAESFGAAGAHGSRPDTEVGEFDSTCDYKGLLLRQLQTTLFPKGVRILSEGTDVTYTTQPCVSQINLGSWQACVEFPCLAEMSPCEPIWSPMPSSGEIVTKKKSTQLVALAALKILSSGTRPILPRAYWVPGRAKNSDSPCRVFALFKPRGMVAAMSTDRGGGDMTAWINSIQPGLRWFTIGGMDKNTSGFLLVTNDGPFANGPKALHACEREYWCGVNVARDVDAGALASDACEKLMGGIELSNDVQKKATTNTFVQALEARQLLPDEQAHALSQAVGLGEGVGKRGARLFFSVTVDTGSFQVLKRMMAAAGVPLATLHLERIGRLRLPDLQLWKPGSHVELSGEDVELLRSLSV